MPYIIQERRDALDNHAGPENAGELNYVLTWHMLNTDEQFLQGALQAEVEDYIHADREVNYALYNEVMGALECCRREWRRRRGASTYDDLTREDAIRVTMERIYSSLVAPYEDTKINQNGDVYQ